MIYISLLICHFFVIKQCLVVHSIVSLMNLLAQDLLGLPVLTESITVIFFAQKLQCKSSSYFFSKNGSVFMYISFENLMYH